MQSGSTLVFHQIIAIEEDETGAWCFQTKGLNNSSADAWRIEKTMWKNHIVFLLSI